MKKLTVKVTPRAKTNRVEKRGDVYVVHVTVAAEKGKANEAVIKLLAEHLGVPKSTIGIVRGQTSRKKTIQLG